MAQNNSPKWISYSTWACPKHIPMTKIPANCDKCWYCRVARPSMDLQPDAPPKAYGQPKNQAVVEMSVDTCAWTGCTNLTTVKSKYCSRQCSNKNARKLAAQRKMLAACIAEPT